MIALLTVLVVAVSAFEIVGMAKRKLTKEIIIYIIMALLTLAIGYYYILVPYGKSVIYYVFSLFGIN